MTLVDAPLPNLLLSIADDKFFLGHRNSDWTGLAPILEEDIAFSSLSQDELAHASALYQFIAALRQTTADRLAFGRKPQDYRSAHIVELSDEFDWATALCRNFFCDHCDAIRLACLAQSSNQPLAQLAGRLAAEEQLHIEHTDAWMKRLGRGSTEANQRMQEALDRLSQLAPMLWEPTDGLESLEAENVYPGNTAESFRLWSDALQAIARDAGLRLDLKAPASDSTGGRRGRRSAGFAALLDELTEVYRLAPEAAW